MKAIKVSKQDNGWIVTERKTKYDTQLEAVTVARDLAKKKNALLIVHKANGDIYSKKTVNYSKHTQPRIYGKRNLSDKDILTSIIAIKEAKKIKNDEAIVKVAHG